MFFAKNPSKVIRKRMVDLDMNCSELANAAGVTPQTVSAIVNGRVKNPRRDTMELIANALKLRINTIWPEA